MLKIALDRREGVMDKKIKLIFKDNKFYEAPKTPGITQTLPGFIPPPTKTRMVEGISENTLL
jgi:hypothetical protein